jgi:hypothetical protein
VEQEGERHHAVFRLLGTQDAPAPYLLRSMLLCRRHDDAPQPLSEVVSAVRPDWIDGDERRR